MNDSSLVYSAMQQSNSVQYQPQAANQTGPVQIDGDVFKLQIIDFSGTTNAQRDPLNLLPNQSYLAVNMDTLFDRDTSTMLGYQRLGDTGLTIGNAGGKCWLSAVINQPGTSDIHIRIRNYIAGTGLIIEKNSGTGWQQIGLPFGNNSDRVPFECTNITIQGTNYLYFTNGVSCLRRTDGTSYSTVQNSATDIICKTITSIQNIIVLGGMSGGVWNINQGLWSEPGTDQFYKSGETYTTSSNKYSFEGPIIKITAAKLWNTLVYVFTQNQGLKYVNPFNSQTGDVYDRSTISVRGVCYGEGMLVWFTPDGRIKVYYGSGQPVSISREVENIIKYMDATNIPKVCIGIQQEKIRIWIGDINNLYGIQGLNFKDVELEYDIRRSKERQQRIWRVRDNKPAFGYYNAISYFGFEKQYMASNVNSLIYARDAGQSHDGTAINSVYITPDYLITDVKAFAMPMDAYLRYIPQGDNTFLTISYAINGSNTFIPWINATSNTKCGLLEAGLNYTEKYIKFPQNVRGRSFRFKFEYSGFVKMQLLEFRVQGRLEKTDIKPSYNG